MVPFPSIPEIIPEGDEEEEEEEEEEKEQVPLQRRTRLARAIEQERRKSATGTSPSTQGEPLEVSSSKDEVQQWVDGQSEEGNAIFKMSDFDFMPVGTELVGDKIRDTPIGESQQEDWMQMPPDSQGPDLTSTSPP